MKKLIYTLIAFIILLNFGCKKDEATKYNHAMLVGKWHGTETDKNGCFNRLDIKENEYTETTVCSSSAIGVTFDYTFDGSKMKVNALGSTYYYKIEELTNNKLVVSLDGDKKGYSREN